MGVQRLARRVAACVAILAQIAVVAAASADGVHRDASAHVEQRGTQLHYAHNEATCPGCLAQSLHARVLATASPLPQVHPGPPAAAARTAAKPAAARRFRTAPPRAPPAPLL